MMSRKYNMNSTDKNIRSAHSKCRIDLRSISPQDLCHRILKREQLADTVALLEIEAPLIVLNAKAGQFVIVRPTRESERIPLTISDMDPERGTISIIVQEVGRTTKELGSLREGDCVGDLVGPLGKPTEIENCGTAVCIGGGVGIAFLRPIVKALREADNNVISILGARDKSLLILENEMKALSDEIYVSTDNGSYGRHGLVTDVLNDLISSGKKIGIVFAIGPQPMMRAVSEATRPHAIKTIVSLDPIMIDGTGMCGGCRVTVGGEIKFTCVDGPDFDGHLVDWDELRARKAAYFEHEKVALERREPTEGCRK